MPYLYGFNINSIQPYIFQTGKLKEIIGGSELVEQICKDQFIELLGERFEENNLIQSAAGRVRYLFEDKESCQSFVRDFPMQVIKRLPGAAFTQALVTVKGNLDYCDLWNLEKRLDTQRNRTFPSLAPDWMIVARAPRTGGPLFQETNAAGGGKDLLDQEQWAKIKTTRNILKKPDEKSLFSKFIDKGSIPKSAFATEFEDLLPAGDKKKGWLAVVHADGNSLGRLIQNLSLQFSKNKSDQLAQFLRRFSVTLDEATCKAVTKAFEKVVRPVYEYEGEKSSKALLALRPIILGGDDLTLIIRGNLALDFTAAYLKSFEDQTKLLFGPLADEFELEELRAGMTACAGISFVKFNYPFHYAVELSESLCKYSKGISKKLSDPSIPSCLAFHKVQSSFVGDYQELIDGPLSVPKEKVQFNNGPYFLHETVGYHTVDQLQQWIKAINRQDAPKSRLREWLTELKINPNSADQLMKRIHQLYPPKYLEKLGLYQPFPFKREIRNEENKKIEASFTPIYDMISMSSIYNSAS